MIEHCDFYFQAKKIEMHGFREEKLDFFGVQGIGLILPNQPAELDVFSDNWPLFSSYYLVLLSQGTIAS